MKGRSGILCCAVGLFVVAAMAIVSENAALAQDEPGAVYILTNQATNSVLVFARAADGTLSFSGSFAAGFFMHRLL